MVLTLEKAKSNLINAQKEAARAYKNVEKARVVYNKLLNKKKSTTKKSTTKKSTTKKSTTKKSTTKKSTTKKSTKKSGSKKRTMRGPAHMRGGGGSDWLNTVNSRGNVAGPDNHWGVSGQKWSTQFEKSGEYISNSELRRGGYQLQESAALSPKVPYGLYADSSVYGQVGSGANLGTQRI
jgi:hypothetical protein